MLNWSSMVWGFCVYFVYMIPLETDVLRKHRFQKLVPSKFTKGASKVNCLYNKPNFALFWLSVSNNMADFNMRIQFE